MSRSTRTSRPAHSHRSEKFSPSQTVPTPIPRSLGSGPSSSYPPTVRHFVPHEVWNQATKISVTDFFSVFSPINQRFYRCSVCGNRVRSNIYYLFLHTYACRSAICEQLLQDAKFRQRLSEILNDVGKVMEAGR